MSEENPTTPGETREHFEIRSFLHPAAGGLILVADWIFFSSALAGLIAHAIIFGFLVGFVGTSVIQHYWSGERWKRALFKGVLAGALVGFPIPIGSTLVGGLIIALSGLDELRRIAAHVLAEKTAEPLERESVEEE